MLTTEALISELPEKKEAPAMPGADTAAAWVTWGTKD